jgi:hypothetical protein
LRLCWSRSDEFTPRKNKILRTRKKKGQNKLTLGKVTLSPLAGHGKKKKRKKKNAVTRAFIYYMITTTWKREKK